MSETPDPFKFISKQKWITITAIGSILTFTLINKIKEYILFPLMNYLLQDIYAVCSHPLNL